MAIVVQNPGLVMDGLIVKIKSMDVILPVIAMMVVTVVGVIIV